MSLNDEQPLQAASWTASDSGCLIDKHILLAGLGNIGSYLAVLLAPIVSFVRLVDRDVVEARNTTNQFYGPEHEGVAKVDATAERIGRLAPHLRVERRVRDVEDLPWGDIEDVDVVLAGFDSLRSRQVLAERSYSLQIPVIDGAVGEPLLTRVQVLLPGKACLECSWGPAQYQQLSTEYPCEPGALASAPRTLSPGCAGAATAAVMVAQCGKLFSVNPPEESFEINGDLLACRFLVSRRRLNQRCHIRHNIVPKVIHLSQPFAVATVADLVDAAGREFGRQDVQLEFRRGILDDDLFGPGRFVLPEQLQRVRHQRLGEFGLTLRDHVIVHANQLSRTVHVCLDNTNGSPT